jgi:uroporphyrinogen III methyltransferase/synthase
MARDLRVLGATVIEAPSIRTEPLPVTVDVDGVDLVVVSSPNGADRLFAALRETGRDARALAGARVAVVGPGTADAVRRHGVEPDIVPARAIGEALAQALGDVPVRRALVVRAEAGRTVVADGLRDRGAEVVEVSAYRTVAEPLDDATHARALRADWATFTSGSTVRAFVTAAGGAEAIAQSPLRLASIGPQTTEALRELGLEPDLEAAEHTPAGLVAALVDVVDALT